ncbi:MAG: aspartyl-phosphate phosphatase Spo0E family protein [Clostridia bacterium]|nr:aspartyl-phosphate phosphatase Spo0E family protein [Clostridia bacterium]
MLNDEIRKKREELNKSIEENKNYDYIYRISVELDELIAKYYREVQSPLSQIRLN